MYKSNINFNLYKTFYEVCKHKSISETAKQTYTSQPAISKSIKKLEEELNTKLFYRNKDGVELTEKGKELFFFVEQSYNNLVVAERSMLETNDLNRGKLSVGMPSNVGSFFLFDKIIEFHDKYPNIEISIITGSTSRLLELLKTHQVDFIIDTSPINIDDTNLEIKELKEVDYVFFANKDTKLFDIKKIKSIKDLKDKQLILPIKGTSNRIDLDNLLFSNNIEIDNVLNVHTSEIIVSFVKKDLGIGYVIKDLVENEPDLEILKLKEKLPTVMINIVFSKKHLTNVPIKFIKKYIYEDFV